MDIEINNDYLEKKAEEAQIILKSFNTKYINTEEIKLNICHLQANPNSDLQGKLVI